MSPVNCCLLAADSLLLALEYKSHFDMIIECDADLDLREICIC